MYVPAFTEALVTAAEPLTPVIVVGPVAVNGKSLIVFVPPCVLLTVFVNVNVEAWSLFVIEHVALWPLASTRLLPVSAPAVQLHEPAV